MQAARVLDHPLRFNVSMTGERERERDWHVRFFPKSGGVFRERTVCCVSTMFRASSASLLARDRLNWLECCGVFKNRRNHCAAASFALLDFESPFSQRVCSERIVLKNNGRLRTWP
jgi:hypothetical protein